MATDQLAQLFVDLYSARYRQDLADSLRPTLTEPSQRYSRPFHETLKRDAGHGHVGANPLTKGELHYASDHFESD